MESRQLSHSLKDFIFDLEKKMNENPRKVILKVQFFREERSKDIFEIDNTFYHSKKKSLPLL